MYIGENAPEVGEEKSRGYADIRHPEGEARRIFYVILNSFQELKRFFAGAQNDEDSSRLGILAQQEIPEHVRDDDNNGITTSNATHSPRNDKTSFTKTVKHDIVPLAPRNDSKELNDFKKRAAFTLAEVLITLGIIGVVAAMTIPTLVSSYKKKVVESRIINFYSVMNNAVKMSEMENGSVTLWNSIEQDEVEDDTGNVIATPSTNVQEWFDKYFSPYVKTAKIEKLTSDRDGKLAVYFNNGSLVLIGGSSWFFYPYAEDFRTYAYNANYTDIPKSDCGTKFFTFYFNPATANNNSYKYHKGKGVEPYMAYWDGTLDDLKNNNMLGCKENVSNERAFCTKLIQLNNWKIPDDYPLKF